MIFYHGTVEAYLPEIMEKGLEPCPENSWDKGTDILTRGMHVRKSDSDYVYLTLDEMFAAEIAISKAEYLGSRKGHELKIFHLKKTSSGVIKTKPVLLKVDMPDEFMNKAEIDPHSEREQGIRYKGSILPKYISKTDDDKLKLIEQDVKEAE